MQRASAGPAECEALLAFWFDPATRPYWFAATADFDRELARRFGRLRERAAAGALADWETSARGCLGLVLLLDQLPRNLFRDDARAFATDAAARAVAERALGQGFERQLDEPGRLFLYLPFEHAEDLAAQDRSVALISQLTSDPEWARHAREHRDTIARFGRFPWRNAVLGRTSTPAELRFLADRDGDGPDRPAV